MTETEKARQLFKGDNYAVRQTEIVIESVENDCAVCSFISRDIHKNADGAVMGGAIYTLADFAFAVAANSSSMHTVTLDGSVKYLKPGVGDKLTAVAKHVRLGRAVCVYSVTVDDGISDIAVCTFTGYRTGHKK